MRSVCLTCAILSIAAGVQPRAQAQVPQQQQQQQQKQQQQQPPPQDNRELIRSLPPVRSAAPPPEAIAVQHSSSFLYRQRREEVSLTTCSRAYCFLRTRNGSRAMSCVAHHDCDIDL